MHGRWRLFRHEAGRAPGLPAWAYVALFAACLVLGIWSARTFSAVLIWPANGVMLAAFLQLKRRQAIGVLAICFTLNLLGNVVRGDATPFLLMNALLNLGEAVVAGIIARRVCGAALDLRRPRRLAAFAFLAVLPAVMLSAVVALGVFGVMRDMSLPVWLFHLHRYFDMELLGLLIVTPTLMLIGQSHRFQGAAPASRLETAGLMVVLLAITGLVFIQTVAPTMFVVIPFLLLVALRLSPSWAGAAMILTAAIAAAATVTGHGPITLTRPVDIPSLAAIPPLMRQLSVYYLFLLAVIVTVLPVSAIVSERRRLMARLEMRTLAAHAARRRAEDADAAKSRFLAMMSHEMRTPLNSVTGYAEVLARRPGMDAPSLDHLGHIQRSGDALLMLVEDVLEVSRGDDALDARSLSLPVLMEAAAGPSRMIAADKGIDLTLEVRPAAEAPVIGDPRRLRQALHHLIGNAVKFTERGGVSIVADRDGDDVVISVTDTGCGLDLATAPDVFAPFVQGDDSISRCHIGAGIGLSLVRRHADLMGGSVTVDSRPGEGSTFTLRLPLRIAPLECVESPIEAAVSEGDCGRAPRILVVDDHPTNREVIRLMLDAIGCDVMEAADGDEAIDMAQAGAFDLILMDVRMPRVDGLAATRAIRALPGSVSGVPILAVTADAMPEDADRCLAAGMDGHLAKPISHKALYAAMDRLLSGSEACASEAA